MWLVSAVCLGLLLLFCVLGPFVQGYRDNLAQRISFGLIFIGTFARWSGIVESQSLQPPWLIVAEASTISHIGFALFGLGTAWKVWKHRIRKGVLPPPPPLDDRFFHEVHGRGPP